jgi:membrane protease YdiL (CAAX protease family)
MTAPRRGAALAEVVLCSGFPTQLALTGLLRLGGLSPLTADGALSLPFVAIVSAADTVLMLGLIIWFLLRRGEEPVAVFLGVRSIHREAALGLGLGPLVLMFIAGAMAAMRVWLPALHNVPDNPLEALARTPLGFGVLLAVAVLAGGVREELQRAFLLRRFESDLGGAAAGLAITSAGFGLGHTVQGWDAVIVTACLGAFWGFIYLQRRSVVASVVSHSLANAAQIVLSFARAG